MFDLSDVTCAACSTDRTTLRSTDIRRVCKSANLFSFLTCSFENFTNMIFYVQTDEALKILMLATFSFKVQLAACLPLWRVDVRTLLEWKSFPLLRYQLLYFVLHKAPDIVSRRQVGLQVVCLTLLPLAGVPGKEVAWMAACVVPKAVFTFQH